MFYRFLIKYGINFQWHYTLYLILNAYVQSSLMEYEPTFMYRNGPTYMDPSI